MSDDLFLDRLEQQYPDLFKIYRGGYGNCISVGSGWEDLIDRCCAEVTANDPTAQVVQIKEKFGGLRFYLDTDDQERLARSIIAKYEAEAERTCELCGKPGHTRNYTKYYIRTVCDECQTKKDKTNG
jgi:hypothetical protein